MRFACGDMRDHILSWRPKWQSGKHRYAKTTTDLRIGAREPCGSRGVQESTFARFSGSFDFRLLQQYRHETDMPKYLGDVRCWVNSGNHMLSLSFSGFDPSRPGPVVLRCTGGHQADGV